MRDEKAGGCYDCVQGYDKEVVSDIKNLTHVFNATAPTETGKEVNVDGYSFTRGEGEAVYYKIDVVINGKEDEKEVHFSVSPEDAMRDTMEAIAYFCKHSPEKVVARSTMALPPIEANKTMRYQLMSGDIKGRVLAWFSSEEMAKMACEAYNFICDYSFLYKTNNGSLQESTLTKYLPWVYRNKEHASIDILDKDGKVVFNALYCINSLFMECDVICHGVRPKEEETNYVEVTRHDNQHDAIRYLFLVLKWDLEEIYHFLTPPELYVEKRRSENVYDVKFRDYNIPVRISFDRKDDAIEFAEELRNLFEYNAKKKSRIRKEYRAYGEPLSIKDFL